MSIATDTFIKGTLNDAGGQLRPPGAVIAVNMIDAIDEDLVKPAFVTDFYHCWRANIVSNNLSMDDELELFGVLDDMKTDPNCLKLTSRMREDFFLEAQCPSPGIRGRNLYTVLKEHHFWNKLVDDKLVAHLGVNQITCAAVAGSRGRYDYPDTGDDEIPLAPGKTLGNRLLWVAPMTTPEASKVLSTAISACNYLGLIHHYTPPYTALCALRLPPKTRKLSATSARPTNGDAGSHTRFKVCAVARHDANRKKWGTTVDLAKLERGAANCDGKRERVFEPIDTEQLGFVRRSRLGQINNSFSLTRAQDHAKFADYAIGPSRSGWSGSDIFHQLKGMGV